MFVHNVREPHPTSFSVPIFTHIAYGVLVSSIWWPPDSCMARPNVGGRHKLVCSDRSIVTELDNLEHARVDR
jgi:hypothetical protein